MAKVLQSVFDTSEKQPRIHALAEAEKLNTNAGSGAGAVGGATGGGRCGGAAGGLRRAAR